MVGPQHVLRSTQRTVHRFLLAVATLASLWAAAGCGGGQSDGGAQAGGAAAPNQTQMNMPPGAQQSPAQASGIPQAGATEGGSPGSDGGSFGVADAVVNAAPTQQGPSSGGAFVPPPVPPGAVQAQVGVGAKGRSLDQFQGAVVTPAKTLFAAKERVVFDIQVPQALQLFKATNGQGPATHDEFMQRVIAENNIQLPQLPAGRRYQYDPPTEQLMVAPE
ncbi:MAG: hypothetical protein U1A77_07970 [Pirellulales bacterium]